MDGFVGAPNKAAIKRRLAMNQPNPAAQPVGDITRINPMSQMLLAQKNDLMRKFLPR